MARQAEEAEELKRSVKLPIRDKKKEKEREIIQIRGILPATVPARIGGEGRPLSAFNYLLIKYV
jgi:hypothetical protein